MKRTPLFRHTTPILALLAGLALPCAAQAEAPPSRVAVVDYDRLLLESDPGRKIIAPMDALMKQKKAAALPIEDELKKLRAQAAQQADTATPQQLASLQRQFNDKLDDLRHFESEANADLDKQRSQSLGRFNQIALPVIQSLGKEMGYTMVLQLQKLPLLYLDPVADITDAAMQRLNAGQ